MDEFFEKHGYKIIRNFYDVNNHTKAIPDLFEYTKSIQSEGILDSQTPFTPTFYTETEMNKIQIKVLQKLEEESGLKLYPTYNYFRIYNKKSILTKHTDRPSCEISITMTVGYDGDNNWPLWITDKDGKDIKVYLEPGDALLYLGCDQEHWREDADDKIIRQTQVFLHYVNQDGPHTNCIFDLVRK